MLKLIPLVILLAVFAAEVTSQKFILPTYRPPPRKPIIIRTVRDTDGARDQPQWLYQGDIPRAPTTGDHPYLPPYIDDVQIDANRRYARSLDSPSSKRHGGSSNSRTRGDNGATHPGYNRRNAREVFETN
ncbi:unnamed protein product [Leptidea sinapis]|uniref:Uncharacterized protein n=1 Tax=Leptidea sinapis TaxID=189913 RepID=A0A5E4QV29_9NEOP|nr:unnamed protein product [Leptidea sinapis]